MRKRQKPRDLEPEVKAVFEDLNYEELKRRGNSPLSARVAAILEARGERRSVAPGETLFRAAGFSRRRPAIYLPLWFSFFPTFSMPSTSVFRKAPNSSRRLPHPV